MRIGLTAQGSTADIVDQARSMEAAGFSSLWFASTTAGDPLVALAFAAAATSSIEVGTAVLQTYPCHPLLQANRATSVVDAAGRGFTLGIGPSHEFFVRGVYGLPYEHPGRNAEEYVQILTALLRGEAVDFDGESWTTHSGEKMAPVTHPVSVMLAAMGPRMLRVAGELTDGTMLFLAPPRAIETHIAPKLHAAAAAAGRGAPRIVAGMPVAVHDDADEARSAVAATFATYDTVPAYRHVMDVGGVTTVADMAVVGTKATVRRQLQDLVDAGATDVWPVILPVGGDPAGSMRRTREALAEMVG
jgi:F420-dependent oxidoreductase-like protein